MPGGSEINTAEQEAQLIGSRAQAGSDLLVGEWKIKAALALGTIENRWGFERFPLDALEDLIRGACAHLDDGLVVTA